MKICILNSYYPPYVGGAETYVSNLGKRLVRLGHDVTVYCGSTPLGSGLYHEDGVRIVRMRTPLKLYGTPIVNIPIHTLREGYDVFHCNFPGPYFVMFSSLLSRLSSVPAVLTWHNDLPGVTRSASALVGLNERLTLLYLKRYSRIIATTKVYAASSRTLQAFASRTCIVANGVDTKRFHSGADGRPVRTSYGLDGLVVLFVGSLSRWHTYKGLDLLLEALKIVRYRRHDVSLLVVGDGAMRSYYERLALSLDVGDAVRFAGYVDGDVLPEYYAASDICVLPSKNSSEGYGLVLLEAMASGKAVVGTKVGGVPEVITDGVTGVLVNPGDPSALAEAIERLCEDERARSRMGREGRQFSLLHDWDEVARQTARVYAEASS